MHYNTFMVHVNKAKFTGNFILFYKKKALNRLTLAGHDTTAIVKKLRKFDFSF